MTNDPQRDSSRADEEAPSADRARTLYQVRVPIVFDHLNEELRQAVARLHVDLLQQLGRGAAIIELDGLTYGKFELWFELNAEPPAEGLLHAADEAVRTVEASLDQVGLPRADDERGLYIVHRQVVTTPLAVRLEAERA